MICLVYPWNRIIKLLTTIDVNVLLLFQIFIVRNMLQNIWMKCKIYNLLLEKHFVHTVYYIK